uniref:Olfactory receptor n=1 Tax=Periophthalmus magnuspinnatus TaxID=409849 RepID=A0A3B3Z7D1_9GOBI
MYKITTQQCNNIQSPLAQHIIHPPGFYIVSFQTFPYIKIYFIVLAFMYLFTVIFNAFLIFIVIIDPCLHTPKFLVVVNLAIVDTILSTSLIPSMIKVFLLKDNFISYNLCMVQMYVYYAFISMESHVLVILSYDRFIAICFPLRQASINTVKSMFCITACTWGLNLGRLIYSVTIMTRLSFCDSVKVSSYFCDYAPVFRLACNDNSLQWSIASASSMVNLIVPFCLIILTYVVILVTVFKMKTIGSRLKALATCIEHIVIVAVFFVPIITVFLFGLYIRLIDADKRVLTLSMASCFPPFINPIVYSLKTKEIKTRWLAVVRKLKVSG